MGSGTQIGARLVASFPTHYIGRGIVAGHLLSQTLACAALCAAMTWSLVTFTRGIPVSETHGLIGGIVGAGLAAGGADAVYWSGLAPVGLALIISPVLGFLGAVLMLAAIARLLRHVDRGRTTRPFLHLQRLSSLYIETWPFLVSSVLRLHPGAILSGRLAPPLINVPMGA